MLWDAEDIVPERLRLQVLGAAFCPHDEVQVSAILCTPLATVTASLTST